MKLRKKENIVGVIGKILNTFSSSKQDTYSADYINTVLEKHYSTEEQFTGKYWIDGKKIYRKVINDVKVVAGVGIEAAAGLSIIDKVTKLEGLFYNESTRQYITIPSYYNSDTFITANFAFAGYSILIDSAGFNGTGYIAIEYTKTTD